MKLCTRGSDRRWPSGGTRAVGVRSVAGAGHSIWYGHFDEFMAVLDGWI